MSTTGSASPLALIPIGIAAGAVYLCAKAMEVCPEERERQRGLMEKFEQEWKKNKLKSALNKEEIMRMPLTLNDPEPLLKAAATAGFKLENPTQTLIEPASCISLRNKEGDSILLTKDRTGKLEFVSNKIELGHSILHRHTLNKVVLHYEKLGMSLQTRKLSGDEIEITGKEKIALFDGRVKVKTKVLKNGTAEIDVSGLKGSRCQSVVKELCEDIGAELNQQTLKPEFYQSAQLAERQRV